MPESIVESLLAFLVMIFRYEVGTVEFYIAVGCTLAAILVVARLFAGLFGSSKGIFVAVFATLLPLLLGAVGYVAVELYALPEIQAGWATTYLPWSVFGVLVLLVALVLSAKLWGIGAGSAVVTLILAGVAHADAHRAVFEEESCGTQFQRVVLPVFTQMLHDGQGDG